MLQIISQRQTANEDFEWELKAEWNDASKFKEPQEENRNI